MIQLSDKAMVADYFAVQNVSKPTTVHHKLTQCCISIIIKQKEKSLESLLSGDFLNGILRWFWEEKRFQIVLNGTERHTYGFEFISGKPLNSPEATAGNSILNPTWVWSHTGTLPCSWAQTSLFTALSALMLDNGPCGRPALCCFWHMDAHCHLCPVCCMRPRHSVQFQSLCGTMS